MNTIYVMLALFGAFAMSAEIIMANLHPIADQYIVVFKSNTTTDAREAIVTHIERITGNQMQRFSIGTFGGFSGLIQSNAALLFLQHSENVDYIEQDQKVFPAIEVCKSQKEAVWGLSRIVHHNIADGMESEVYRHSYNGKDVIAYIIDTGIEITHPEFNGRAVWGANFADTTDTDCNGHGTHVAGTVGGTEYGVAKEVQLVAIKVLACSGSGSNAGVIQGVNFAVSDCTNKKKLNKCLANMSLGGGVSNALDDAVNNAVAAGVGFVVAAGNSNQDACLSSPARAKSAITVAASYYDFRSATLEEDSVKGNYVDIRSYFSNYGTCVDIIAPGQQITSSWINGGYATISGTSMASPHVAGVSVLALSSGVDVADLAATLTKIAVPNAVTLNCGGVLAKCDKTPNLLLQSISCVKN